VIQIGVHQESAWCSTRSFDKYCALPENLRVSITRSLRLQKAELIPNLCKVRITGKVNFLKSKASRPARSVINEKFRLP
jgi:hypothetical protein